MASANGPIMNEQIPNNLRELVNKKFESVVNDATGSKSWYKNKRAGTRKWSRGIRFCSIILIGLGGIFPLVGKNWEKWGIDLTPWGYITIAIAGIILFIDRFFGFSSAWIRYTSTEMEITRQLNDFESGWHHQKEDRGKRGIDR
jgi:hypothetical protein